VSGSRVFLPPLTEFGAESVVAYEVLDSRRRVIRRGHCVPGGLPKSRWCELVVAAPDVLLLDVALPKLTGARLRAALPMLVEEMLLGDIEQSLVVAGRPDATGRATVAAVDRALLSRALEVFRRLRLRVTSATPEPLTLKLSPSCWRIRLRDTYACVRTGERLGLGVSRPGNARPPEELTLLLAQAQARPSAIEVEGECDLDAWRAVLEVPLRQVEEEDLLASPAVLELLQYDVAPGLVDWSGWRVPMALAALALVLWTGGLNAHAWLLKREERAMRQQMEDLYKRTFPNTPVVLDPVAQMRRGVTDLRASAGIGSPADFLPLASRFAQTLGDHAAVRSMEYRDAALQVRLDMHAFDTQDKREALSSRAARAGLSMKFSDDGAVVTLARAGQ
jgi:general secretion pathway protein L